MSQQNEHDFSDTAAMKCVCEELYRDIKSIRHVLKHWKEHGEVYVAEKSYDRTPVIDQDVVLEISQTILERRDAGLTTTIPELIDIINQKFDIKVTYNQMRHIMANNLKYEYGKMDSTYTKANLASRDKRIRKFLFEYSRALQLQSNNQAVIIYSDESYIHQKHKSRYGWHKPGENELYGGTGKGPRLIMLHAMTADGLVYVPVDDEYLRVEEHVQGDALSAEVLYQEVFPTASLVSNMQISLSWQEAYPGD